MNDNVSLSRYFLVKVDQFIDGYDPIETVHLVATKDLVKDCIDLLGGLWIDKNKVVGVDYASFFDGQVRCELSDIKEIEGIIFELLKELGL